MYGLPGSFAAKPPFHRAVIDAITSFKDGITGGAFEALTAASGDSHQLRFLDANADIRLLELFGADNASDCDFSIASPLLHDPNIGIRVAHSFDPTMAGVDGNPQVYFSPYQWQRYRASDTLTVQVNGTAADDVTLTQLVYYDGPNVPNGKFIDYTSLMSRMVNIVGIRVAVTPHATTSTYGTAVALNATSAILKANTEYALLGVTCQVPCTTFTIKGPETGNFRVPMPGHWDQKVSGGWFIELARRFNLPLIPTFNANNAGNIMIEAATAGGGTTPLPSFMFGELS